MEFLQNHRNIKVRFNLVCLIALLENDKAVRHDKGYFLSDTHINIESTNVEEILSKIIFDILYKLSGYQNNSSGWFLEKLLYLEIHTVDYKPMRGGSSYIPLPDWIMRKKAIVSIRNRDNKCFIWSALRYLHPREKNDSRLSDLKKYENELNTKGIKFPVKVKDISKFESLNPDIPGINVFSVNDNKKFYPQRSPKAIDLFLYEEDGKYHYYRIKNFSRLFRSQITSRTNEPIHICKRCFNHFTKKELLPKHIKYCLSNETVAVKMPPQNTFLKFVNYNKQFPIPFVIYSDFECFTKPMSNCSPNPEDSYSYNYKSMNHQVFVFISKE